MATASPEAVAYAAGNVVVTRKTNHEGGEATQFVSLPKTVSALSFFGGELLAVGEKGSKPRVLVLRGRDVVAEFPGAHQFGVSSLAWSPSGTLLASSGFLCDGFLRVFNVTQKSTAGGAKLGSKVFDMVWEDEQTLLTVGHKTIRYWRLGADASTPLLGKAVTLADKNNECFVACAHVAGVGSFALTTSGMLCSINSAKLTLDRWVNLQGNAYSVAAAGKLLLVGVETGAVHAFEAATLKHVMSLSPQSPTAALAVRVGGDAVHVFHADKSRAVFSLASHQVAEVHAAHAGIVWACDASRTCSASLPEGSFVTCGSDNTIRVWNAQGQMTEMVRAGAADEDLLRVAACSVAPGMPDFENGRPKGEHGLRVLKVSDDGLHVATGDRDGALRVFDHGLNCVAALKAHDSDVLCLDFSRDSALLASASRDRRVNVYSADTGFSVSRSTEDHSSAVSSVRFCDDKLLSVGQDKSLVIRSVCGSEISRDTQKSMQHGTLFDLAVEPSARKTVVVCGQDKKLNVYGASGKLIRSQPLSAKSVDSDMSRVVIDPTGQYAIIAGKKQLSVVEFGGVSHVTSTECDQIMSMCLTSDLQLVTTSADCVLVWALPAGVLKNISSCLTSRAPSVVLPSPVVVPQHQPSQQQQQQHCVAAPQPLDISMDTMPSWLVASPPPKNSVAPSSVALSPGLFGGGGGGSPLPWHEAKSPALFGGPSSSPLPWQHAKSPLLFGTAGTMDLFGKVIPMQPLDTAAVCESLDFVVTPIKSGAQERTVEARRAEEEMEEQVRLVEEAAVLVATQKAEEDEERAEAEAAETARLAEVARIDAEAAEAARLAEVARIEAEAAEAARLAEVARIEAEAAENARLAEVARIAAEAAENARLAEVARIEAEAAEAARLAEVARIEAEAAESARLAEVARIEAEAAENARLAEIAAENARLAEVARIEAEAAENARLAEVARIAAEAAENARLAEVARIEAEAAEAARLAEVARIEAEAAESARLAEVARIEAEAAENARLAEIAAENARLAEVARIAAEAAENARLAEIAAENARLAEEVRIEAETAEAVRLAEVARIEAEVAENARLAEVARIEAEAAQSAELADAEPKAKAVAATSKSEPAAKENSVDRQLSEIEKTRERLARMGMLPGAKRALGDGTNKTAAKAAADKYRAVLTRFEKAAAECRAMYQELQNAGDDPALAKIRAEVEQAFASVAPRHSSEHEMLESYSDKLMAMFTAKMDAMH